ncbi:hypothetical protein PO124_23940 [Bacillus licheniformis]|nr:hypothetical protein [Bacillus licheniformis]
MQIQFLNGVSSAAEMPDFQRIRSLMFNFLNRSLQMSTFTLKHGLRTAARAVEYLGQIDDLISLQPFSSDEIKQQLDAANQTERHNQGCRRS